MQDPAPILFGRSEEMRALKRVVTGARNGVSGAVVLRGDPGIGKTALLENATSDLSGFTLVRSDGFEAELALPYAGLQRVGMALAKHVVALPSRQRRALRIAWGSQDGPAPDRFMVGLAMLALFAEAGAKHPVVCVLDDAHWLDPESRDVLAFVARRLQAESTVLLFAARDGEESDLHLAGIPSIRLAGLQHRGGPPGFIDVPDPSTIVFPDYPGNQQYVTLGNLDENNRVALLFIDYPTCTRVKVFGRARLVERAGERVIDVTVEALDTNCRKNIPVKYGEESIRERLRLLRADSDERIEALTRRIAELETSATS